MATKAQPVMPSRLADVPPFPPVMIKLLHLLGNQDSKFTSIAACIATDPTLSARLLQRANAADQARFCEVKDVLKAALALGMERTREVTLAAATLHYAGAARKSETLRICWRHTVACALAASEIARQCGLPAAELYTAGLLHDIGRLGLISAYPVEYDEIIAAADGQPDDLLQLERERFGVDHAEVGLWLAKKWNLPDPISTMAARHHEPLSGALDSLAVLQMACRLADLLGFSVNRPVEPPRFEEITAPLPLPVRDLLWKQLGPLQNAIVDEVRFFEGEPARSEESEAVERPAEPLARRPVAPRRDAPPPERSMAGRLILATAVLLAAVALIWVIRAA